MGHTSQIQRTRAYRAVTGAWESPALIACSGGVDSTALVLLAAEARRRRKIGEFTVCHVDHRSRPESAAESDTVAALCASAGVPFIATSFEENLAPDAGSQEAAWREARYRVLFRVAREVGAARIVTGHTRDDQIETILLHGLSGSGWRSMQREVVLSGFDSNIPVLRPLLDITRQELEAIVHGSGVSSIEDESNQDVRFRRNAIRHLVIPAMESAVPGSSETILRSAILRETDAEFCDLAADLLFADIVHTTESGALEVARQKLAEAHKAVSTRVVLRAARSLMPADDQRELSYERVTSVVTAAASAQGGALIELPNGIRVEVERDRLVFRSVQEEDQ